MRATGCDIELMSQDGGSIWHTSRVVFSAVDMMLTHDHTDNSSLFLEHKQLPAIFTFTL